METRPGGGTLVDRATAAFARYQGGEREALDELVEALTPLLWRTARGAGLDPAAAEDVVQSAWLSLLRSGATIRDPHTVVKWLLTTVRRESWRVSKRVRADADRVGGVFGVDGEELMTLPDRPETLPDETVLRSTRQRRLWEHVHRLPARCRQLVGVIAFADRPDYALLAESLGMPVGSIGPTRGRCLAKLRAELDRDPEWEGQLS
ncbi:sigma-70 family RNA polymerase sigma factor [Nocardioides mesophilus]|uniref:Sigma-70 family RNA polymerase sigma factor n=1 Tax=Nocardioides mesophilus TaxID=433659 RepID=A0A7G9RH64_9ACTN|nr:sigma-70 family RNA polymerase sigma factor [Nocardioides mesophilus]